MRKKLKMSWTNGQTDNNTHKTQWQPHFSKVIFPQYPNPSPCTVGRTDEHLKWQQYHQHQCRMMVRHLDTSACQILYHFSKWFVSETARLNRCRKNGRNYVEYELSMPDDSNNEFIHPIWAQTAQWFTCKCTKTLTCDKPTDRQKGVSVD